MVEQFLTELEVKTLRLVSRRLKCWIDTSRTALKPRAFSKSQELGLVRAFPNLERLELRHYTHAAPQEYMSEYEQLTALTRLTSLKLDLDEQCHHPTLIQGVEGLSGLTPSLQLKRAKALSDEALQALRCLVNLRELSLSGALTLDGIGMAALRDLPQLRSVDMSRCGWVNAEGLRTLAGLTRLTAFDGSSEVNNNLVTIMNHAGDILGSLFCLTGLQRLDLRNTVDLSHGLLQQLAGLSRLTALHIDRNSAYQKPAIEGSALLDLRELRVLSVAGWHIYLMPQEASYDGSGLAELALTELRTSMWLLDPRETTLLNAALRGGKLRVLELMGPHRPENPCLWTAATTLTCLSFSGLGYNDWPELHRLSGLKSLTFSQCWQLGADFSHRMSSLTTLEKLDMRLLHLRSTSAITARACTEDLLVVLGSLSTLTTLVMPRADPITKDIVAQVAQLSMLQDLDLSLHRVHDLLAVAYPPMLDLRPLSALTQLTSLRLGRLGIQGSGLDVVRNLKGLRILKLTRGSFTDCDLHVLTGLTALRSLSLKGCNNITDKGLKAVVVPLSKESLAQVDVQACRRLTSLSLAVNMGVVCCKICGLPES